MNNITSPATITLDIATTDEDWINASNAHEIAQYAIETSGSNETVDYQLIIDFQLSDDDGAIITTASITPNTATFIADSIVDSDPTTELQIIHSDFIVKTITITPTLREAAANAYNATGLSIFMESLNQEVVSQ